MKKLSLLAAALVLASAGASAATNVDSTFNVSVTFTSSCSASVTNDIAFTYTAFQTTAATGSTNTVFTCSRGMTPTFMFDDTTADVQTGSAAAGSGTLSAEGVIKGLRYRLTAAVPAATAGTAAKAGAAGAVGTNGTADTYSFTINGSIPAGQAGDAAGSASQLRTLTLIY